MGNKFEFRMVGSSQNIALANIVLNTAVANSFREFADKLESASDFESEVDRIIQDTLTAHKRILFSGNSYSEEWEREAGRRGLCNFKTAPEAYAHIDDEKNVELFESLGVMSRTELRSRREIFFESYRKIKNIEAKTMLEMTSRDYIPAVNKYLSELSASVIALLSVVPSVNACSQRKHIEELSELLHETYEAYAALSVAEDKAVHMENAEEAAFFYKGEVAAAMDRLRQAVDGMEVLTAREHWPVPTYGDMTYRI
jgi:glutamine synthetase